MRGLYRWEQCQLVLEILFRPIKLGDAGDSDAIREQPRLRDIAITEYACTFEAKAVALPINDIDTDHIIPARWLKTTNKAGLGDALPRA